MVAAATARVGAVAAVAAVAAVVAAVDEHGPTTLREEHTGSDNDGANDRCGMATGCVI